MEALTLPITPGQSLGQIVLGSSLHRVLKIIKKDRQQYQTIDLHYNTIEPLSTPVIVSLPSNGIRLQFDGPNQRLRLIEVLDFNKLRLTYKGSELSKHQAGAVGPPGPSFKRIYQLFGAAYPGEYLPPEPGSFTGTYVLSWPGVAFNFPLQHAAWSHDKDHVSLLNSSAAFPAAQVAIFEGTSWAEARPSLFVKEPSNPTAPTPSHSSVNSTRDGSPATIEMAGVRGNGTVELLRHPSSPSFCIVLNQTTCQDLVAELGPPDAIHKRDDGLESLNINSRFGNSSRPIAGGRGSASQPSSYSSTGTDTFDTDFDSGDADDDPIERASRERFWCYFDHGMDILVGPPVDDAHNSASTPKNPQSLSVVTKVVIHGNVPGSYAFNRHRRLRWYIDLAEREENVGQDVLISEDLFDSHLRSTLMAFFAITSESELGRGKVINRTWSSSPSDSSFFLPDAGEDLVEAGGSEQWLGNTKLYEFPGLVFEVLNNGVISALTIS